MNNLLIIESPNKIHTISKFLDNKQYKIIATIGHIRDLPSNQLGFDEKTLEPKWIISKSKDSKNRLEIIKQIKDEAKQANNIYLATDPDREGEAISWHVYSILPDEDKKKCKRIIFNEITKTAIQNALNKPRDLDWLWVKSQFTRRILDRLVGYKVSKVVRNKVGGRSAGRVQSIALKMIYDRENEIQKFKPTKWWTLLVDSEKFGKLILRSIDKKIKGIKWNQIDDNEHGTGINFYDEESPKKLKELLSDKYQIYKIDEPKLYSIRPKEAYKTSTLQQDGINQLKWSVSKVTSIAQKLYEGIKIDNEHVALISYPRTDSTRISESFIAQAKKFIETTYGKEYFELHKFNEHTNNVNFQDAHEAIRVINPFITPLSLKNKIPSDELKLYKLIWYRTLASLMSSAKYENTIIRIKNNDCKFYTYSRIQVFAGYKKLYVYDETIPTRDLKISQKIINTYIKVKDVLIDEHTTLPPPRFNQASLIKELDNAGVGRPSTYRSMANMALERGYAQLVSRSYVMLPLGNHVIEFLSKYFDFILDVSFTSSIENDLDKIANGKEDWKKPIQVFQPILSKSLKKVDQIKSTNDKVNRKCPKCGGDLVYRYTKNKGIQFIGCSNFPKCKYVEFPNAIQPIDTGLKCPKCGHSLTIKTTKKGRKIVACNNFPQCHFIMKTDVNIMKEIDEAIKNHSIPNVKIEEAILAKKKN